MPTQNRPPVPPLRSPSFRPLGAPQHMERSIEYGPRGFTRVVARLTLRGTTLEGDPARTVDAWARDFWQTQGRERRQVNECRSLENGDYQIDVLDPIAPIPAMAEFKRVVGPKRAALRSTLRLVIGATHGGEAVVEDVDAWPHAIIGGSSGDGKSTFVSALLAQIADKPPALVRLALGDMANADLQPFADLPHAIGPLASDTASALALFGQVEAEINARQVFLSAPFALRQPDGGLKPIEGGGFINVDGWNRFVVRHERPDLTLPRLLVVVDEWKQAIDGSAQSVELAALAGRLMRVGRKWGARVWLIAQEPKKGSGRDVTFPSDIMTNAGVRIALASKANPLLWRLMLGETRRFDDDRPLLADETGKIPVGRGILLSSSSAAAFQGLYIGRDPDREDRDDNSTELTRFLVNASRTATMGPEARLLSERPYAPTGRVLRVVTDPQVPGDAAVQIEYAAAAPVSAPIRPRTDYTTLFDPPTRADPVGRPRDPNTPYREDDAPDPDDEPTPRRPTQVETRRLEPLTALRFLYRAQIAADAEGAGPIEVSRAKLAELIRQDGRIAPGNAQLTAALRLLRNRGLLADDGRCSRLVHGDWTAARDALRDAPEDADGPDAEDDPEGPEGASVDDATDPADGEDGFDSDAEDDAA